MSAMTSQITSLTIVYSAVYSGADQRKHQSSASLAFVREIHRWPVNSPHKWPVTRIFFHLMTSSWHLQVWFIKPTKWRRLVYYAAYLMKGSCRQHRERVRLIALTVTLVVTELTRPLQSKNSFLKATINEACHQSSNLRVPNLKT